MAGVRIGLVCDQLHAPTAAGRLVGVCCERRLGLPWCMDTLYNLEHGKYLSLDTGMILEMLINLSSFASPAILIPYFWRNRRWFGT
jgi:hypothetical protein